MRINAMRPLAGIAMLSALVLGGYGLMDGRAFLALFALALAVPPCMFAMGGSAGSTERLALGAIYPLFAALACMLAMGSPWQLDMHMLFFAYLAVLALLADWRVIVVGAGLTALHHIAMNFLSPQMLFSGGADLARVMFHAAILVLEAGALTLLCTRIEGLVSGLKETRRKQEAAEEGNAREQRRRLAEQGENIKTLSEALGKLSAGDFTHRVDTADTSSEDRRALGEAFNSASAKLAQIIGEVSASATSVSTGSSEIRAASDDLATRNEKQAASLEETASAMREVTKLVRQSATNAGAASESMAQTHKQAREGGKTVERAVEAMSAIEASSGEITQIIDVIDSIAFQTNLLALNAGVEAARAGEAGKGFAVVATEVRALAQRSADAAKDIKKLISASSAQVSDGVALVGETGDLLGAILDRVGEVTGEVDAIAEMAASQASNLEQVSASIEEMDQMTQRNAAMVEQTTAAARSLSSEASRLEDMVARFDAGVRKKQPKPPSPATATQMKAASKPGPKPAARKVPASPPPVTEGNLALKPQDDFDDQDWSEF
jgi:methyl-accepting chemotaxis protein